VDVVNGNEWARHRGRHRVVVDSSRPVQADDAPRGPLVTQGGRSTIPRPQPTPDAWLRGDVRSTRIWDRLETEMT
jgi:hypothetical protein